MAWVVLVYGFFGAPVEGEVVFVVLEAGEGAEDAGVSRFFVDSGLDGEVEHCFHFGGAQFEEGVFVPGRGEIGGCDGCHGGRLSVEC